MGLAARVVVLACLLAACLGERVASAQARAPTAALDPAWIARAYERADALPRLHALIVARSGRIEAERRFRGPGLDVPVNVKSISKSILSALVGIAIAEGKLEGVEQPIAPFFPEHRKSGAGPRLHEITIGDLLSMRSGLARTSGESYGPWVRSRDWVAHILRQPLVAEPGIAGNGCARGRAASGIAGNGCARGRAASRIAGNGCARGRAARRIAGNGLRKGWGCFEDCRQCRLRARTFVSDCRQCPLQAPALLRGLPAIDPRA